MSEQHFCTLLNFSQLENLPLCQLNLTKEKLDRIR